jgi:hypothetical protein
MDKILHSGIRMQGPVSILATSFMSKTNINASVAAQPKALGMIEGKAKAEHSTQMITTSH